MLTIYKASAGSGKTFTLTYEYIKLVLGVRIEEEGRYVLNTDRYLGTGRRRADRHRGVLAITFTNAATEEMKSRIIKELAELARNPAGSHYTKKLIDEFGCTREELTQAAHRALTEILLDYSSFNVSTIDSFFQMVLRTFARELDHQGDFELTLDEQEAINISISLMLDELNYMPEGEVGPLLSWIENFTMDQLTEGKGYNFFNRSGTILRDLSKFMNSAMDETFRDMAPDIRKYLSYPGRSENFASAMKKKMASFADDAQGYAAAFFAALSDSGLKEALFNKTLIDRMHLIIDNAGMFASDPAKLTAKSIQAAMADEDKFDPACLLARVSAFKGADKGRRDEYMAVGAGIRRALLSLRAGLERRRACKLLLDALGRLQFVGYTLTGLRKYLSENNIVMISDTGDLIDRIINGSDTPFIYERLGMRLTNLLIDEFQDTSGKQWENLRPLVANSISFGNDNLIIGDEKQSIYRFRNSDSRLLGYKVATDDFPDDHIYRGSEPEDNTNRRSSGLIVRFNNTVFSNMAHNFGATSYDNVIQNPWDKNYDDPAYIKVHIGKVDEEEILDDMAKAIIAEHERGYRWKDILILVRKNTECVNTVNFLLNRYPEIQVLSNEALLLCNSPAVRTIMSMLKLVQHSYAPARVRTDENGRHFATRSEIALMETRFNYFSAADMDNHEALQRAVADYLESTDVAAEIALIRGENPVNLIALIEAVIKHKLPEEDRRRQQAYITALQDLAVKHCEGPDPSVTAFIEAYERNINRWAIKAPASLDAVRVMTVHKSKGLESDCLHIPFAGWEIISKFNHEWLVMDRGLEGVEADIVPPALYVSLQEDSPLLSLPGYGDKCRKLLHECRIDALNLLYVAFTRARRELNIYTSTEGGLAPYIIDALESDHTAAGRATLDLESGRHDSVEPPWEVQYTFGAPTVATGKDDEKELVVRSESYETVFRIDAREITAIDDIFATDFNIGDEMENDEREKRRPFTGTPEMQRAAMIGNHLHAIMADMTVEADLEQSIRRNAVRYGFSEADRQKYQAMIRRAFEDGGDRVSRWFDPSNRVMAERSIYDAKAGESYRPDRVVFTPDGATILVDYKFTRQPELEHREQIKLYVNLLRRLGYGNIEAYLWYPARRYIDCVVSEK